MNPADYDAWYDSERGRWIGETEYRLLLNALAPRCWRASSRCRVRYRLVYPALGARPLGISHGPGCERQLVEVRRPARRGLIVCSSGCKKTAVCRQRVRLRLLDHGTVLHRQLVACARGNRQGHTQAICHRVAEPAQRAVVGERAPRWDGGVSRRALAHRCRTAPSARSPSGQSYRTDERGVSAERINDGTVAGKYGPEQFPARCVSDRRG